MTSHFLHLLIYSTVVSTFFGQLLRHDRASQWKLAAKLWGIMVGGSLALAYAMYLFQR